MSSPPPASVPVVLGLGLGGGTAGPQVGKPPPPPASSFTFMQLQELQQQALIYKYMSSGLPVPLHLVLPIWKSVVGSAGSLGAGATAAYCPAAFMMGLKFDVGLLGGFDYKNLLEPEPGRCRRTDGKKWRCSRDVVADHKYCDKHLHRGRNRSRKHVEQQEAAAVAVAAAVTTTDAAATGNKNKSSSNKASMVTLAGSSDTAATALVIHDVGNGRRNDNNAPSLSPVMCVPPTSLQLMPPTPHCSTTSNSGTALTTSAAPVDGGGSGINSLATLRSNSGGSNNSAASNMFHPAASPQQMFGLSPTSVPLGGRVTSGISIPRCYVDDYYYYYN